MTKFIEFIIDGNAHAINIDNIAMIKQIQVNLTEIHLLTNKNGEQIKFQVAYNYGNFRYLLDQEGRFGFAAPLNEFKQ